MLEGLRVVDLADEKGELCGRLLADLGAEVIRVEPPGGARSRGIPPFHRGESLYFAFRNFNKRGAVVDLEAEPERLHALLEGADVLIESHAPAELERLGLRPEALLERHPQLVITSISDFGHTGPYRDRVATDPVLEAMGGTMFKAGVAHKPPLCPPNAMAYDTAAVTSAYATLLAVWQRRTTGRGQHIDLSVLEAVAQTTDWSYSNASLLKARGLPSQQVRAGSGPVYPVYPCKDGFLRLIILSPRQWRSMREWLGEPEAFQDPHWDAFMARLGAMDVLGPLYVEHFASLTAVEAAVEAQRRGIACTPVQRPEEVLANEHFQSRATFADAELAAGLEARFPTGFFEVDGERMGFRTRAPSLGEHEVELSGSPSPAPPQGSAGAPRLPLEGVRVLDFGIGGVGVEGGRMLAEYGADVVKIETRSYPDFIRVITGAEMSPSFASSSRSKRGFGVNAKQPEGLAILHRLVECADVLVENGSKGMMEDLGVGWEKVHALNPRAILVSSQFMGSRGAWSDWIGYGPSGTPVGGLFHLWDYDDDDAPVGGGTIFPDHLAGRLVALGAVASLLGREGSGKGTHTEVAQVEAITGLLGDLLAKASLEPGSVRPRGNRSERGAPWGAYPCEGEQEWCVITVRDDADWQGLVRAMGDPEWARDARFADAEGRQKAQDELDERVGAWTATLTKDAVTDRCQTEGVPAGPMLTASDQFDDPHFTARGYAREVDQQDLGPMILEGPAFRATGMADARIFQAPRLGEHTADVCREWLGMADAEIDPLLDSGALEGPPEPAADPDSSG